MQFAKIKRNILEIIYHVGIAFMFSYYWVVFTQVDKKYAPQDFLKVAAVCFVIKLVLTRYKLREYIIGLLILALTYWCYKISGSYDFFVAAVVALGLKDVDFRKTLKVILAITVIASTFVVTWNMLYNMTGLTKVADYGRGVGVEVRYRLGWGHPNQTHFMWFSILGTFFCIAYRRLQWWVYLVLLVLNYEGFLMTKSKTGYICTIALIIVFLLLRYGERFFHFIIARIVAMLTTIACIAFSFYCMYTTNTQLFDQLNTKLTGRLFLAKVYIQQFGIHLFGTNVNNTSTDMGMIRLLVEYGPILFVVIYFGVLFAIWQLHKHEKYNVMLLLVGYVVYFTVEAYFQCTFDLKPILIAYAYYLWSNDFKLEFKRKPKKRKIGKGDEDHG